MTSGKGSRHLGAKGVIGYNRPQWTDHGTGYLSNSEGLQRRKNAKRTNDARYDIRTGSDTIHINRNNQTPSPGAV